MHQQTDEQSSRSEKWLKFSGNVEAAWQLVKNASGRRATEVFMETTEEHKVLRPIKRAKIHKSHTVTEKGPSRGKIGPTEPRGVDGTKIRDPPAEKRTWVLSTKKLNENWDAISLMFLSAVNSSSSRSTSHNLSHIMFLNVWNYSYSYEARVKCKIGYDGGLITWISAKPTDWTPEVPHLMKNGRKIRIMRRTSCSSLSRVLSTRSSCSTSPTSPTS